MEKKAKEWEERKEGKRKKSRDWLCSVHEWVCARRRREGGRERERVVL